MSKCPYPRRFQRSMSTPEHSYCRQRQREGGTARRRRQTSAGFSANGSDIISTDEIDYEVRWNGDPDVSILAGKPVRVQLEMRNA
jgi:hypothetical protein